MYFFRWLCLWVMVSGYAFAEENVGVLPELMLSQVSDRSVGALGQAALGIRAADWRHAESRNFVYHFFHSQVATPVAVEAEFYYGVVAKEMEKDTAQWERKSHIYVFERAVDWAQFVVRGGLDPWTGGLHSNGELFIVRNPEAKWQGSTLGHEVAHLVVHRFFGNGVPLWLNEGYAEYSSSRNYAAFYRARGYAARPRSRTMPPGYMGLGTLVEARTYPQEVTDVGLFYAESERLTRFLSGVDKRGFGVMFEALSKGARMESALSAANSIRVWRTSFSIELTRLRSS